MASVNTLIRKGYLLAGVMMAANMFIVNEVKAMEKIDKKQNMETEMNNLNQEEQQNENLNNNKSAGKEIKPSAKQAGPIATLLGKKDIINLVGTFAVSCLNNYFNLWDYKSGKYLDWKFGFFGWRTKRFLNDYLQFEVNLNVYRGLGWGILYFLDPLITKLLGKGNKEMVMRKPLKEKTKKKIKDFIFNCAPGFISVPLTLHIFNISIAISLDSIAYGMVEMVSNRWWKNKNADLKEEKNELKEENSSNDKDIENKKEEEEQSKINKLNLSEKGKTNETNNNENGDANLKDKGKDNDE